MLFKNTDSHRKGAAEIANFSPNVTATLRARLAKNQYEMMLRAAHQILARYRFFLYFTWFTRILLAMAFVPSGLKKVLGERFTVLAIGHPVGFFFEALYRTGFYWHFLGFVQLFVAVLLLIPRTTTLGALLYLPVAVNIFCIVVSMHFIGTPVVAGLMLLANLYLLLWDYPKISCMTSALFQKT